MIRLNEVAKKIENILNGVDEEILTKYPGVTPPTGFQFMVKTEGFHLDKIADFSTGKNVIPVFISSMGGNFNPVPELLQANYVIPITFYFPVRFKDEALLINEYLAKVFVGRQLDYGEHSKTALSNISVAQYGEIVDLDLKQFAVWVKTNYLFEIDGMEPYIQMTISLYLSTCAEGYVFGNDANATLSITIPGDEPTTLTENITFVQGSVQSHSDPAVQQLLGTNESEGLPTGTSYGESFSVYIKDNEFFKYVIEKWFDGDIQTLSFDFAMSFLGKTFNRECFVQSVNLVIQKGELATITFAFSKKASIQDGGL